MYLLSVCSKTSKKQKTYCTCLICFIFEQNTTYKEAYYVLGSYILDCFGSYILDYFGSKYFNSSKRNVSRTPPPPTLKKIFFRVGKATTSLLM